VEPEVGRKGMMRGDGDHAVFECVAGNEAEDADGFDADVLICGSVQDRGTGSVRDGAGQDVGGAALGMGDACERNFDGLEAAVEVEIETRKLAGTELVVDLDDGVDLFAAVSVAFKTDFGFEQFDLGRSLRRLVGGSHWRGPWRSPGLLRLL